jgi:GMP synthase-like glutamine amidotransferase
MPIMRPVLFVKADPAETFGVGPAAVVDAGAELRVWDAIGGEPAPPLGDVAGIVLFGSSFNIEHADEQPFIHSLHGLTHDAVDAEVPFLGICFGAQVLAWSLGAEVRKAPRREVGYVPVRPLAPAADDPLLSHLADGEPVFQWHMDTFDLPVGAELLVTGDDVANQAYRLGATTWATQFHLEIDVPELELWVAEVADTVEREWGKSPPQLRAEAATYHERHEDMGREVFRRFVKVARERG